MDPLNFLDKDIMIKLINSESFEEFITYADIINLLHNQLARFGEIIESTYKLDSTIVNDSSIDGHIYENMCKFLGYLMYKFITNDDERTLLILRDYLNTSVDKGVDKRNKTMSELVVFMLNENNLNVIFFHKWIINDSPHSSSFVYYIQDEKVSHSISQFIVNNYEHFNTDCVWEHIRAFLGSPFINKNDMSHMFDIVNKCIEKQIPKLDENMYYIYDTFGAEDKNREKVADLLLRNGVKPSSEFIKHIFRREIVSILELFYKYNIDIKQICNKPVNNRGNELISCMAQLGIDIETYLHIITIRHC